MRLATIAITMALLTAGCDEEGQYVERNYVQFLPASCQLGAPQRVIQLASGQELAVSWHDFVPGGESIADGNLTWIVSFCRSAAESSVAIADVKQVWEAVRPMAEAAGVESVSIRPVWKWRWVWDFPPRRMPIATEYSFHYEMLDTREWSSQVAIRCYF